MSCLVRNVFPGQAIYSAGAGAGIGAVPSATLAEPLFHEHAIRVVRRIAAECGAAPKPRGLE